MWKKAQQQLKTISNQYAVRHFMRSTGAIRSLPPAIRKKVTQVLDRFVAVIPKDLPTDKKAALLYYVLTSQIQYDMDMEEDSRLPYTFIGALCQKKAVCMGIAELFTYLCHRIGVKAVTVIGYACSSLFPFDSEDDGGLHAWVMVRMSDGNWYHADPTWDLHKEDSKIWQPKWFLLGTPQMERHYFILEDYPKAKQSFTGKIELNQKGVDLLCQHWKNLVAEFRQ